MVCDKGSPSNCKITKINAPGYSAGIVLRVDNGRRIRRSTENDSCPKGFKIWSPRSKSDWNIVYNAKTMGLGVSNGVSKIETQFRTPSKAVFDNYAPGPRRKASAPPVWWKVALTA